MILKIEPPPLYKFIFKPFRQYYVGHYKYLRIFVKSYIDKACYDFVGNLGRTRLADITTDSILFNNKLLYGSFYVVYPCKIPEGITAIDIVHNSINYNWYYVTNEWYEKNFIK